MWSAVRTFVGSPAESQSVPRLVQDALDSRELPEVGRLGGLVGVADCQCPRKEAGTQRERVATLCL